VKTKIIHNQEIRMSKPIRLSDLSPARQSLVRLCREINYGQISGLVIRNGEPVLDPQPAVLLEAKFDLHEESSPLPGPPDFELGSETVRLMARLDEIQNGTIERLDVRHGIPTRAFIPGGISVGRKGQSRSAKS
jgi:hypothetical protein